SVTVNISFLFRLIINKTLCLLQIYHFNGIACKILNKEIKRMFAFAPIFSALAIVILKLLA
ncbi:MAG: hypothetical protein RL751_138, partial [Bacteroidota bacterium]